MKIVRIPLKEVIYNFPLCWAEIPPAGFPDRRDFCNNFRIYAHIPPFF